MRESAVIRMLGDRLVWYPPGSSGEPRSLEDSAEQSQLQAILAARRAPVLFAVPGAEVTLREVEFSAAEKRHIAKSLPYMLEDDFAADIEELHFASRPLNGNRLGVAVCAHAWMDDWQQRLLDVPGTSQWIPEPLLLPWRAGELCLVIEADSVLVRSGENAGFSVERSMAAPVLAALEPESADAVIVYGADQAADTALLPPWMQDKLQWRTGNFAAALMLAEEERQTLNLRQGSYGANLPLQQWWQQWRVAAGLFAAAFALQVASTYANYSALETENLQLRQQIEAAYRSAIPRGAIVDPEKQLQRQLDDLRGAGQGAGFVSLMDRIGRVMQSEKAAQLASVNFNDKLGDVRLNLVAPDFRTVEAIRAGLDAAGLQAETENSNAQGNAVRARLKVREK
ncbi:MAG: type II secretion system protein GspL [Halieaceae bacterium]